MLGFPLIPMAIQTILLLIIYTHETPKFLYTNNKAEECEELLKKIYNNEETIKSILEKFKELMKGDANAGSVSWSELFGRTYRKALIVVFCIFQKFFEQCRFTCFPTNGWW